MIEYFVSLMQVWIQTYGAWGVFVATILEEIIAPIPSPIVPLSAGFFLLDSSSTQFFSILIRIFFVISLPVALGVSIGSSVVYAIGFFGGKPLLDASKKWLDFGWDDVKRVEQKITKGSRDEVVLFVLRLLPIIPGVAISGLFGLVRYSFIRFIIITFLGSALRALLLGFVGWKVGEVYAHYAGLISRYEKYILFVIVFSLVSWFLIRFVRRRSDSKISGSRENT